MLITHAILVGALTLPVPVARYAFEAMLGDNAKPCPTGATRLVADSQQSTIRWKGTKFLGLGSHEGTVALQHGELCVRQGNIVRAVFVANMRSIEVTDIPASDPVPRKRLRDHLISEDFFHVERNPQAILAIDGVRHENRSLYVVSGRLTMRGVTHPVSFYARIWENSPNLLRAEATLKVNRQRWGIAYRGSTLRDDLVDDEFTMQLMLVARAQVASS